MNKVYFTEDFHLDDNLIIHQFKRPFSSVKEMNDSLIENSINELDNNSILYHLGDFCITTCHNYFLSKLDFPVYFIKGNHDKIKVPSAALLEVDDLKIMLLHKPPFCTYEIPMDVDFVLCGHVHTYFKHTFVDYPHETKRRIPVINVGVDVCEFKPISLEKVIETFNYIK